MLHPQFVMVNVKEVYTFGSEIQRKQHAFGPPGTDGTLYGSKSICPNCRTHCALWLPRNVSRGFLQKHALAHSTVVPESYHRWPERQAYFSPAFHPSPQTEIDSKRRYAALHQLLTKLCPICLLTAIHQYVNIMRQFKYYQPLS